MSDLGVLGFSHFRLLGLFEELIKDNISPLGWGTMFQVLKVLEGTGRPAGRAVRAACILVFVLIQTRAGLCMALDREFVFLLRCI